MSDTEESTEAEAGQEVDAGAEAADETDWQAEAEKWKALSRKNEDQAKANAEKAKRFDEIEEASKTEQQKLLERAETAEKALADRDAKDEQAKLRKEVAKAKGVPESALRGTSKEELEEHADELIAAGIKPATGPSSDGQGDVGGQVSTDGDMSADDVVSKALDR